MSTVVPRGPAGSAPEGLIFRRWPAPRGSESLIEQLWVVHGPAPGSPRREVLVPDGRPQVVVPLGVPGRRIEAGGARTRPNDGLLCGLAVEPVVLEEVGPSWYVGVRLTVTAVGRLTGGLLLVDDAAPAGQVLGVPALADVLRDAAHRSEPDRAGDGDATRADAGPEVADRAAALALAEAVTARAQAVDHPIPPPHAQAIERAVRHAEAVQGRASAVELAAAAAVDPSTLRRWFVRYVGVGPKAFLSITRFYHFAGELLNPVGPGGLSLPAALQGYADASHAAAEVRRFTGLAPREFRRRSNGIAALMHGTPTGG